MASITPNSETLSYDSFFASTRQKYMTEPPKQAVFRQRVTLDWVQNLADKGGPPGGLWVEFPVTLGSYSGVSDLVFGGTDTVTPQDADISTVGKATYAENYLFASISQDKMEANKGPYRKYDYVRNQIDMAVVGWEAAQEADLWAASQDALKLTSIATAISTTTTTGTVETLNRATYTFWRQTNTDAGGVAFTTAGLNNMRTLYHTISRGPTEGRPDTIFMDQTVHALYERITDARERTEMAVTGTGKKPIISEAPIFRTCEIMWVPTSYPNSTTLRMLNSSTWHYTKFRKDLPGEARQNFNGFWWAYPVGMVHQLWCDALRWNGLVSNFLAS